MDIIYIYTQMEGGFQSPVNKNKVTEFAEGHPHVLLGAIGVLIIVILVMYLGSRGYSITPRKKTKKTPETEDEEVDVLIESIHEKQK